MREAVCFVLIYIFVNITEAVKPKSVNLALETVLQFDKKDQSADVEVLNRVQSFLDNIKHVMTSNNNVKRRSNSNDLKFTDFLLEAAEVLNSYDDNDLEDFFAVLDDQSRKYHYKGCKFYELVENNDVRRYMSNKLEQAKDTSAKTMRRYLKDVVQLIASENYDRNEGLVNLVNSLYDGASNKFENVVKSLRTYRTRSKDSTLSLESIVSNALRTIFFDHYTNLNDNARQNLKTEIGNYWLSSQYNGGKHKKDHNSHNHHGRDTDKDFKEEIQDYKSKLRVIDVPSKFKNEKTHKRDRLKVKGAKGSYSYKKNKRQKSKKSTPKIDIDFFDFKKTTRDNPLIASDEDNTKNGKKQYGVTQGLVDEDISNSYEVKKPSNREKSHKPIITAKSSGDKSGDGIDNINISGDSKEKKGISIDVSNEKYISAQKKKQGMTRHKKSKIGHITYDVERRIKLKAHDYSDDDSSNGDPETDENGDSDKEVTHPQEKIQEDSAESGILIGGQNVQTLHYRAEHTPRPPQRKAKGSSAAHSEDSNFQASTKKLKDRKKSHHKSSNKTKNKKKATLTDAEEETTLKTIGIKENKDSAFASSDEGITIETFENGKESGNKYSNLRKANKPTTASNSNVHKRIHNLEQQMEDVKQRMKLVVPDRTNSSEEDTPTNAKGRISHRKVDDTRKNIQSDAKGELSDQNNKAYEIRVHSEALNNSDAETTNSKRDTITVVEYVTGRETKPSRTTMLKTSDEKKNTRNPTFRSELAVDSRKSQKRDEKDTVIISTLKDYEVPETVKEHKTTKTDLVNDTTLNARTDSIFKTSEEAVTELGYDDQKNEKNTISTKVNEESKSKTILQRDVVNDNAPTKTTVIDLTKHLKESDTVVVNIKDKSGKNIAQMKETTNVNKDLGLPKNPFSQEDKADPFNDIDINLDVI